MITHRLNRRVMACEFEVIACDEDGDRAAAAAHDALDEAARLEFCLSRFVETSDIARVNARGAAEPVRVSPETVEVLEAARRLCAVTDHAFDVTAAPLTRLWREARANGRPPGRRRIAEALAHVGMHHVHTDADDNTVWLDQPGTEIDLGAIGKGFAVDRAAEALLRYGIADFAVCGAESTLRVLGTAPDLTPRQSGWLFRPRNPLDPSREVAAFCLSRGAVATSSQTEQQFRHRGKVFGHVLDPRTGWPVPAECATILIAPNATEADALATAFLVLGPERSSDLAKLHCGVSVAFIECGTTPDEARLTWSVRSEDLPAEPSPVGAMCRETIRIQHTET